MPRIQHRRNTKAQWLENNPVMAAGELGVEVGTNGEPDRFKIGNGLSTWDQLKYFINETELDLDVGRLSEESLDARYLDPATGRLSEQSLDDRYLDPAVGRLSEASLDERYTNAEELLAGLLDKVPKEQAELRYRQRPNTAVIVGDSITENNTVITTTPYTTANRIDGYFTWASMLSGHRLRLLKNAGIAGNTIEDVQTRFDADVLSFNPGYVIMLVGTNSIRKSVSPPTYEQMIDGLESLYLRTRASGAHLIQMTIPPCGDANETTARKNLREKVNNWLRSQARLRSGFTLVDIYPHLASPSVGNYALGAADQIHPNMTGAAIIGRLLADAIIKLAPSVDLLPGSNFDLDNLATNGMHVGVGPDYLGNANIPTSWYAQPISSGTFTATKISGSDSLQREWTRFNVTAGGVRFAHSRETAGLWVAGDKLVAVAEFRTTAPWTSVTELSLVLAAFDSGGTQLAIGSDFSLAGYTFPIARQPPEGVFCTPPITLPPNVTKLEIRQTFTGVGSIDWGRSRFGKIPA